MVVTISQPRYLPYLGYFHRIAVSDVFVCLDVVQYTPRDWENRNRVKTPQGWTWLTVPVHADYRALTPEVQVANDQSWQEKHWKTLRYCYSGAPYFDEYRKSLQEFYKVRKWNRLVDLNLALMKWHHEKLGITDTQFVKASDLSVEGQGSDLILDICNALGASAYLSGEQGRNYLDEPDFQDAGISLLYQKYRHPAYPQQFGEFQPFMATIDLMFNCGPQSMEIIQSNQEPVHV